MLSKSQCLPCLSEIPVIEIPVISFSVRSYDRGCVHGNGRRHANDRQIPSVHRLMMKSADGRIKRYFFMINMLVRRKLETTANLAIVFQVPNIIFLQIDMNIV